MEPPVNPTMAREPSKPIVRRLVWTLSILALFCGLSLVRLPSIDSESAVPYDSDLSLTALKLWPFIASFILVELTALTVSSWRRRRQEAAFRVKMKRAAIILGVILAAYQAWNLATLLDGTEIYENLLSPSRLGSVPSGSRASTVFFLVLGSLACLGMALRITTAGVGNGFAVLWLADLTQQAIRRVSRWNWQMVWGDAQVLLALVLVCLILAAAIFAIWRTLTMTSRARSLVHGQIPLSGIWPCYVAAWFSGMGLEWVAMMRWGERTMMEIGLIVVTAPLAAHLFYWPHRRDLLSSENRERWHSGQLQTVAILIGTSFVPSVVRAMFPVTGPWFPEGPTLWVSTAILLDLKEEIHARMRAAKGFDLAPERCFHDVLDALRDTQAQPRAPQPVVAGPAFDDTSDAARGGHEREMVQPQAGCVQALHFRSLFHTFAPYASLFRLVPSEDKRA
jgi:hypothetical protein